MAIEAADILKLYRLFDFCISLFVLFIRKDAWASAWQTAWCKCNTCSNQAQVALHNISNINSLVDYKNSSFIELKRVSFDCCLPLFFRRRYSRLLKHSPLTVSAGKYSTQPEKKCPSLWLMGWQISTLQNVTSAHWDLFAGVN